jgi:hypothetical protein
MNYLDNYLLRGVKLGLVELEMGVVVMVVE